MSSQWHGGKGSSRRPASIDRAKWEENYHKIFGYKDSTKRCVDCGEETPNHTVKCVQYKTYKGGGYGDLGHYRNHHGKKN